MIYYYFQKAHSSLKKKESFPKVGGAGPEAQCMCVMLSLIDGDG